ncbi:helix-turn-helix domain-containing protein [Natronomonas halophila]|uniref:winged helix-turn-helix transcriptional regulator n=1 Tax=Natronomonas halophila TaxID=2747817 RepID=UPI0015B4B0C8|nr:helix-turn-helix domain-containing protein [Natronomonas halophila]QLD85487.1 helix-turn-helix domain-containing protein [Natronomonas halophila]
MSFNNKRRLFALLAAILVVCSFAAVPAAGAGGTSDWSSGLDGSSSSNDTNSTDSQTTESDGDGSSDTNETAESDGDASDESTNSSTTSDGSETTSDGSDDATEHINDTVEDTADTLEDTTESTTDTVEDTTDTLEDTTESTTDTVEGTTDTLALEAAFVNADHIDRTDTTYLKLATDGSLQVDAESDTEPTRTGIHEVAAADADDADAGSDDVAMSTRAANGGQPLPSVPVGAGGIAVSFSLLAGMAALRSTPLVAGGLPSLSSLGTGISTPAILSKLRPFLFPLRYSRYDDSDPLEHEAREEVYEIVNESPGAYLSELSEEAGLPLSTTRHHIKVLEREDLVSGAKLRGKRRFYPAYAEGVELAAALNDEATASIIDAIARLGSASVSDLADDIGRDPSTISHHLQRLEEDGIITREREGRAVMNKLSGEARTALEPDSTPKPDDTGSAVAGGAD